MTQSLAATRIDLWETPLYGFERIKDPRVVSCLMEAIKRGAKLPPVPVARLVSGEGFHLVSNSRYPDAYRRTLDGGHHRALAHVITERLFPVTVVNEVDCWAGRGSVPVVSVELLATEATIYSREAQDPNYINARRQEYDIDFMNEQLVLATVALFGANKPSL